VGGHSGGGAQGWGDVRPWLVRRLVWCCTVWCLCWCGAGVALVWCWCGAGVALVWSAAAGGFSLCSLTDRLQPPHVEAWPGNGWLNHSASVEMMSGCGMRLGGCMRKVQGDCGPACAG
jgi:hypothetical protein